MFSKCLLPGASHNLVTRKVLSPSEAAYLAAFVDGEGTITIGRERRPENRAGFRYIPILVVANTNREGLERVRDLCGNGRVSLSTVSKNLSHKHRYRLEFSANQIRAVLPQIQPFLLFKQRQAETLIEFLGIVSNGRHTTPDQWQRMEQLRTAIRAMNQRGRTEAEIAASLISVRPSKNPWDKRQDDRRGTCRLEGCDRPHSAKGYCHRHYKLYILRGGPAQYENLCERCGRRFLNRYKGTRFCSKACNDKRVHVRRAD